MNDQNMTTLADIKLNLAEALKEDARNTQLGGNVSDAAALMFVYSVMPVAEPLIQCAEFLADALPGMEAYAKTLDNPTARSTWESRIAQYKRSLAQLGLVAPAAAEG